MAIHAELAIDSAQRTIPKSARSTVRPRVPIPERGTVAASAEKLALAEGDFAAVPRLQQREVGFVMAIVAIIISAVGAVAHHDVRVFLGDNDDAVRIQVNGRRLALFVAGVAVEIGQIDGPDIFHVGSLGTGEGRDDKGNEQEKTHHGDWTARGRVAASLPLRAAAAK